MVIEDGIPTEPNCPSFINLCPSGLGTGSAPLTRSRRGSLPPLENPSISTLNGIPPGIVRKCLIGAPSSPSSISSSSWTSRNRTLPCRPSSSLRPSSSSSSPPPSSLSSSSSSSSSSQSSSSSSSLSSVSSPSNAPVSSRPYSAIAAGEKQEEDRRRLQELTAKKNELALKRHEIRVQRNQLKLEEERLKLEIQKRQMAELANIVSPTTQRSACIKVVSNITCSACGRLGHRRTSKECRFYPQKDAR